MFAGVGVTVTRSVAMFPALKVPSTVNPLEVNRAEPAAELDGASRTYSAWNASGAPARIRACLEYLVTSSPCPQPLTRHSDARHSLAGAVIARLVCRRPLNHPRVTVIRIPGSVVSRTARSTVRQKPAWWERQYLLRAVRKRWRTASAAVSTRCACSSAGSRRSWRGQARPRAGRGHGPGPVEGEAVVEGQGAGVGGRKFPAGPAAASPPSPTPSCWRWPGSRAP